MEKRPHIAIVVAVVSDTQVLFTKREDYEVWCLPGGGVEMGETVAEAAVREVREETGLEVKLDRLVGVYSRPQVNNHTVLFLAHQTGGVLTLDKSEVLEAGFFEWQQPPENLQHSYHQMLSDIFQNNQARCWKQTLPQSLNQESSREERYRLRDESKLSRLDFYKKYYGKREDYQDICEI